MYVFQACLEATLFIQTRGEIFMNLKRLQMDENFPIPFADRLLVTPKWKNHTIMNEPVTEQSLKKRKEKKMIYTAKVNRVSVLVSYVTLLCSYCKMFPFWIGPEVVKCCQSLSYQILSDVRWRVCVCCRMLYVYSYIYIHASFSIHPSVSIYSSIHVSIFVNPLFFHPPIHPYFINPYTSIHQYHSILSYISCEA